MIEALRDGGETVSALHDHRREVLPIVRRELRGWRRRAAQIPDPALRGCALSALDSKAANSEATGVLATLAPRPVRASVLVAATALQVAIDYLDTLGEQDRPQALADGLQLHKALGESLHLDGKFSDWYALHPRDDDGGYLTGLASCCRGHLRELPAAEQVLPAARRAAERCGAGQSHTHAATHNPGLLAAWATGQEPQPGFEWWEVAAGASSSVAAHALIALAGDAGASAADAEVVDGLYFPGVGALTVILDDLVDRDADAAGGEHSYLGYYPSPGAMAERLTEIAAGAARDTRRARRGRRHRAILSGVLAFYLSQPAAEAALGPEAIRRLLGAGGPTTRPLAALLRRRR